MVSSVSESSLRRLAARACFDARATVPEIGGILTPVEAEALYDLYTDYDTDIGSIHNVTGLIGNDVQLSVPYQGLLDKNFLVEIPNEEGKQLFQITDDGEILCLMLFGERP